MKITIKIDHCIEGIDYTFPDDLPREEQKRLEEKCLQLSLKLSESKIRWIASVSELAASVLGKNSEVKIECR